MSQAKHQHTVIASCCLIIIAALFGLPIPSSAQAPGSPGQPAPVKLRVAIIDFARNAQDPTAALPDSTLREALVRDPRVALIDNAMMQAALIGIGYGGSLNMSRDEARRIGSAIGCDFFIAGKAEAFTRSDRERESHEDAYAGVFFVDGRTGALSQFEFVSAKAATREAANKEVSRSLGDRAASYVDHMLAYRTRPQPPANSAVELIEDIPDERSSRAIGFTPPRFLNRAKPEYTEQAELANITATVEALAVLRANGEIGSVEISRWAGFGLDESAERTIRKLRFKPAMRDGKPIGVRALIQYNFRRLSEPGSPHAGVQSTGFSRVVPLARGSSKRRCTPTALTRLKAAL